jgi:pantetheine-phosphate adenylyltransferase
MHRIAVYPGSFDPITYGHIDIAERALQLFDEVVIAVASNNTKSPLFSVEERKAMVEEATRDLAERYPLRVDSFDGLLIHYVERQEANVIVRGLRAVSDFEFEFQLALMNRKLDDTIETIFLMPSEKYTYLSSSILKEVYRLGGCIQDLAPPCVEKALQERLR